MADAKPTPLDVRISHCLQDVARRVDLTLAGAAGQRVNFSLFVWTDGRSQYVSNAHRDDVIKALEETIAKWKEGMPDVPAHRVQ